MRVAIAQVAVASGAASLTSGNIVTFYPAAGAIPGDNTVGSVQLKTGAVTTTKLAGSVYGRRMYEIMRYWDEDHPDWEPEGGAFAAAWRHQPKWVVSRSLASVGPNASLVGPDLKGAVGALKAKQEGEIEVAGPDLAQSLGALGLIDEYRIYLHPVVLGQGKPYFAGPRPPLRLVAHDRIDGDVIRLTYVPA